MAAFISSKIQLVAWIRKLSLDTPLYFPQALGSRSFQFARVNQNSVINIDEFFGTTVHQSFRASSNPVPPGKQLSPDHEVLFRFSKSESGRYEFHPLIDDEPRTLAGVRPCDLKAIHLMDQVNSNGTADPYYRSRRHNTVIIAMDCMHPCDEHCFCDAVGSLQCRDGADVFISLLDDGYLIECLSEQGQSLVQASGFDPCTDVQIKKAWIESNRAKPFGRQLHAPVDEIGPILKRQWNSPLWEKHAEKCFSCGTCNLVCPTCYCFDVHDDLELDNSSSGSRYRTADACMFNDFAEVAGGHNFRKTTASRQRHRIKRKFEYLSNQYGDTSFCVGCGRCGHQCTVDIDILGIVNDLIDAAGDPS